MGNFCSNCGNQLREGANFCNRCGNQVNTTSFSNPQIPNYNQIQNGMNQGGYYPYNNYQPPSYGNYNPQLPNLQPYNYSEPVIKERLTWGIAIRNFWSCRFTGRCSRWEWWFTVLTFLLPINFCIILPIFFTPLGISFHINPIVLLGLSLILFFPNISFTARRLHDLNMSGWWQIIFFISLPLVWYSQYLVYRINNSSYYDRVYWADMLSTTGIIMIVVGIIQIIFGLYYSFASGTPGPNKYGPPSKY